jgi:hypothetical protein
MVNVSFTRSGEPASGETAILPVCNVVRSRLNFIGTGFFIGTHGLFITAKHVLQQVSGEPEEGPLYVVHFYEPGRFHLRRIVRASLAPLSDFALGFAQNTSAGNTSPDLTNTYFSLSTHVPSVGESISTLAYPESDMNYMGVPPGHAPGLNFVSKWYHGTVTELNPEGTMLIRSPALTADMPSLRGSSGGPVFSEHGGAGIVGINSAGPIGGKQNIVSLTSAVLSVVFFDLNVEGKHYEHLTVQQLADLGHVFIDN